MGESWIERTAIAVLLLLLATIVSRQWFRVEHAADAVAQRTNPAVERHATVKPIVWLDIRIPPDSPERRTRKISFSGFAALN